MAAAASASHMPARMLHGFEAQDAEELSVVKGERVLVDTQAEELPEGWRLATRASNPEECGRVPASYVKFDDYVTPDEPTGQPDQAADRPTAGAAAAAISRGCPTHLLTYPQL